MDQFLQKSVEKVISVENDETIDKRILNLTLKEFSKCTNIKEILINYIKEKFAIEDHQRKQISILEDYVKQCYEQYMTNPSYRRYRHFKNLVYIETKSENQSTAVVHQYAAASVSHKSKGNSGTKYMLNKKDQVNKILKSKKTSKISFKEFQAFSNVKQLISKKYKTSDEDTIAKYVQETYEKYIRNEKLLKDETLRKLRFAPKPWLFRHERRTLKKYNFKQCYVNLEKQNEFHSLCGSIMKNPNEFIVNLLNNKLKKTTAKNWNEVWEHKDLNLERRQRKDEQNISPMNYNKSKRSNIFHDYVKNSTENVIPSTINSPELSLNEDKSNLSSTASVNMDCVKIDNKSNSSCNGSLPGLEFHFNDCIIDLTEDPEVLTAAGTPSSIEKNSANEVQTDNSHEQQLDLENLTLTSRMSSRVQQQQNDQRTSSNQLIDTLYIQPKELSFDELLTHTNILEGLKQLFRSHCSNRKIYQHHLSKLMSILKYDYNNHFTLKEDWPQGILLRKGSFQVVLLKKKNNTESK